MNSTVWKLGCRWSDWGDPETNIAESLFFKYGIALTNTHALLDARAGHLIALSEGFTVIAIGKITTPPAKIENLGVVFTAEERRKFFNDTMMPYEANDNDSNICGCTVRYYRLQKDECFQYRKMGRFFHAAGIEDRVNKLFDKISREKR